MRVEQETKMEQTAKTLPVTHEIRQPWRNKIHKLLLVRFGIDRAIAEMVDTLAEEAALPKPVAPYRLNDDGTMIVGEVATEDRE
jgi:hypothetical protein